MKRYPNPTQEQANLPIKYACISLLPIFVFCLSEAILATLAHNSVTISRALPEDTGFLEAGEAAARLHLLGMALLVLLSAVAVVVKLFIDVKAYFAGPAKNTLFAAFGLVLVAGAVVLLMINNQDIQPRERLGTALFEQLFVVVKSIKNPGLWSENTYSVVVKTTHVAILFTIAGLISGSISCLAKFPGIEDRQNWIHQSDRLKTYIILSAVFLIIGVFYFKSWADYPAFLLASEPPKLPLSRYIALANAYTGFTGIEYSLVLATYALPVSYIQSRRANVMALEMVMKSEHLETPPSTLGLAAQVKAVKDKEGLKTTHLDMFKIIVAIIAPLITGALPNLATAIT